MSVVITEEYNVMVSSEELIGTARLKSDGTRAETRFGLSAKRTSSFKLAGGQFCRLLAAEACALAVIMLDTPCSDAESKTTGYPLHSHVSPSLPLPCVTVCHQVSTELYYRMSEVIDEVSHEPMSLYPGSTVLFYP